MTEPSPTPRILEEHGFSVEDRPGARILSLPLVRRRVPASFLAGFTLVAGSGSVLRQLLVDGPAGTQSYVYLAVAALLLLYLTLVAAINRITIRADSEGFSVGVGPLPWVRSRRFPLSVFRGPYVAERRRRLQPWRTKHLVYDLRLLNERAHSFALLRSFEDEAAARYAARILQLTLLSQNVGTAVQANGKLG